MTVCQSEWASVNTKELRNLRLAGFCGRLEQPLIPEASFAAVTRDLILVTGENVLDR